MLLLRDVVTPYLALKLAIMSPGKCGMIQNPFQSLVFHIMTDDSAALTSIIEVVGEGIWETAVAERPPLLKWLLHEESRQTQERHIRATTRRARRRTCKTG
jgi:hypothetical protein